jgi:tRNA(Arg) A34 adenosine deaminase TadA
MPPVFRSRRALLFAAVGLPLAAAVTRVFATPPHPDIRWLRIAEEMKRQAESWGDQSYGAVLVLDDRVVGFGPSRVVIDQNPDAHAERVAIRDAQRRLGQSSLSGAILYSTSRPCPLCEAVAAAAQVDRMYYGPSLQDAGAPRGR